MKPSIFLIMTFISAVSYAQSKEKIFPDPQPKQEPEQQTFKYYPDKTIEDIFKKKMQSQELAQAPQDASLLWRMPIAKPDEDFNSNMRVTKPDSSVHHTMRIVKPE